ncbi:MAG: hypothetical protein C4551_02285 [Bacillota bacterium]|nr:MAG: hypothetical protein C4551_02285 [Bacillota bacterium]
MARGLFRSTAGGAGARRGIFQSPTATTQDPLSRTLAANETLRARLAAAGQPAESLGQKTLRGLSWLLYQISRPYYAVTGGLREALAGGGLGAVGREAWEGLTLKEKDTVSDILSDVGWEPETKAGKFAKGAVSFIGDVLLDPATYVTLGAAGVTRAGLKGALKGTMKAAGRELGEEALERTARELAEEAAKRGLKGRVSRKAASEMAENTAKRLGDATLRGPLEEALLRAKPARRLQVGTGIPFSGGRKVQAGVSLARPGEALERALGRVAETRAGGAAARLGRAVTRPLGQAFEVGYGYAQRLRDVGRRFRDTTRAGARQVFEDTRNLAREFEPVRRAVGGVEWRAAEKAAAKRDIAMLHKAGAKVGADHARLHDLAQELFGVDSLTKLSGEEMKAFKKLLKHPDFGKKAAKELLEYTPPAAKKLSPSYAIMRAVDSGRIDELPEALRPFAAEAKETFDTLGATEKAVGALDDVRANYYPHILRGYSREVADQLHNAMAKWKQGAEAAGGKAAQEAEKAAFIAEEMAKGVAEAAALAKWQKRLAKLPTKTRFAKKRTLETFEDLERFVEWARQFPGLEKLAIEDDFVKVMGIRKLAHARVMANHDMLASLRAVGDDLVADAKTAPAHFVDSPVPQLKGVKVAPEVARFLNDFKEPFTNIESLRGILGIFDKGTNFWKGLATAARPGFHIRNAISNVFNNWLAGVRDISFYRDAYRLQRAAAKGDDALRALRVRGKNGLELWREVVSSGVTGHGWMGADIGETLEDVLRGARQPSRGGVLAEALRHPVLTGRRVGTAVEDNARVAHYLAKRAEGLDIEEAVLSVKGALFDYDELTPFERNVLKRVFPFFTWSRKNIPLQFSMLLQQPGVYAKLGHLKDAAETLSTGPDEADLPEWMRDAYVVRLPFQIGDKQLYANVDLPLNDLSLPSGREVLSMLNPLLKLPVEWFTNTQLFSGTPLEDVSGEYVKAPGYLWALYKAGTPLPGWEPIAARLGLVEVTDPDTGEREVRMPARARYLADQLVLLKDVGRLVGVLGGQEPLERLGSPFFGVGLYGMSGEDVARQKAYRENRRLRELLGALGSRGVEVPAAEEVRGAGGAQRRGLFGGGGGRKRGLFGGGGG